MRQTASRLCEYLKSTSAVGRILNDQGGISSSSSSAEDGVRQPELGLQSERRITDACPAEDGVRQPELGLQSERRITDACPAKDGVRQPALGPECSERRTTDVYPRPDHTQNRKDLPLVGDKCDTYIPQVARCANDCYPQDEETRILVEKAATKIRRGLKNLGKSSPAVPELLNDQRSYSDKAKYYEDYLWVQAARTGSALQEATWLHRFLASCFGLIRVALETKKGNENPHKVNW